MLPDRRDGRASRIALFPVAGLAPVRLDPIRRIGRAPPAEFPRLW
ncbi:hypothetical protein BPA30113_05755 [Burkholderia paludis]|uniref:Uncharacterized protein n=1 Tax=Burkholderia paludis TaxID=1506587 RepID=A0A6J5EH83_9BURK|nr:hypothetical protein LMG30113_05068 [Burkholderia paludis]VWC21337.1 hypothetical protein BPA30113_05755 [Burkholderia paludis]